MRRDLELQPQLLWVFSTLIACVATAAASAPAGLPSEIDLERLTLVHWTTEDGLPSNALTNVLQTSEGFIWIATYNGLVRFDGRSFTTFGKGSQPSLPANGFHELVEDAQGTLWIGTQGGGVLTYRDGRFRVFQQDYGRRSTIRSLLISDHDLLWVGVSDFGAYQHRNGELTQLEHPSLIGSTVRDILRDRTGALWMAAEGKGLVRFHQGDFRTYTTRSGLASDAVSSLYESAQGELYVGSLEGLDKLVDNGEISSFPEVRGIEVNRIYGDARGGLWLATMQGLYRRSAGAASFEHFTELRGQVLGSVVALAVDHEGSIWLASGSHGLFQLKRSQFRNYSIEQGLSTRRINIAREITPGEIWAGADNGTINIIKSGEVSTLDLASLHSDLRVRDIHRDRHGTVWIASYAGLLRSSGGEEVLYTTRDGLPTNQLRSLYEDRRGRLWIGTQNAGLVRMSETGQFETLDTSTGLASNFIFSIDEDLEGNLVLGTRSALTFLDAAGRLYHYTAEHGLPGSIVFNTSTDRDGSIWLCTNGGLARFQDGRIRALTAADGLPAESVFDFAEDSHRFVWLSSSHGVVRLSKTQLIDFMEGRAERVEATLLDESDGMVSRDCTGATKFLKARDGTLWFPTLGGLAVADPRDQQRNEIEPRVVISRFLVDGEPVDSLDLGAGKQRFDFQIAALSFLAPEKVRVRYRLEGFDEDWREPDGDFSASYTALPPRLYTFRVIAANNDGVWNEEGATLRFRLRPFFYQRPVFYAAVAALLVLALYRLYRWRLRVVRQRNLELEGLVAELELAQEERQGLVARLEESAAKMERFVYTLSHDLKSPLVTIGNFLGLLEKDIRAQDVEGAIEDMSRIQGAAGVMGRLLDEMRELSRIGRVNVPLEEVALGDVAREAVAELAEDIAAGGVEVVVASDLPLVAGHRRQLREVLQHLIANAVRFRGERSGPRVEIGAHQRDGEVACYVRDTGVGVDPRYHQRIFELFEQLNPRGDGTGIGLAIVKRVVEVFGGRVWVESQGVGQGATFWFTLPSEPLPARGVGHFEKGSP